MSAARAEILARVRRALTGARPLPAPVPYRAAPVAVEERLARFTVTLERVGGHVQRVQDLAAARAAARAILARSGATRVLLSDAPEVQTLAAPWRTELELLAPDAARAELLAAGAGLSTAQWGIAETGTLVLESARERHRLASLLAPVHIAILPQERMLGTLGEALARVRGSTGAPASRTITFVTGPSRTADIELELVVGVHGPKELHVLLLESSA